MEYGFVDKQILEELKKPMGKRKTNTPNYKCSSAESF
jgi:hypothetical protein